MVETSATKHLALFDLFIHLFILRFIRLLNLLIHSLIFTGIQ